LELFDDNPTPKDNLFRDTMRANTVIRTVGALVLILLLVPFIVFTVPKAIGAERSFVVVSSSMHPTIHAGAAVIVNEVAPRAVSTGDIITFRTGTGEDAAFVTHRVIEPVEHNGTRLFRTQGDANAQLDPGLVSPEELVGRVTLVIPYLGQAIAFIQSDAGLILLIGIPIGLLILGELWDLRKTYHADRQADKSASESASHRQETEASNQSATDSEENQGKTLISFAKTRTEQSKLIDSSARDSTEEWSFGNTDGSSELTPDEESSENFDPFPGNFKRPISSSSKEKSTDRGVRSLEKLRNGWSNLLTEGHQYLDQISWDASKPKVVRSGILALFLGSISALSTYWLGFVFLAFAFFFIIVVISMDHLIVYSKRE
jgi:signal peptidase